MPLPVLAAPTLGAVAVRLVWIGAAVAAGVWLARRAAPVRFDPAAEAALDGLPEGAELRLGQGRVEGGLRWARAARLGEDGPGVAVEIAGVARLRARRLAPRPPRRFPDREDVL